jgi:hypothetical protein
LLPARHQIYKYKGSLLVIAYGVFIFLVFKG